MKTDTDEFKAAGCFLVAFVALMGVASVLGSIAVGLHFGASYGFAAIAACVLVLAIFVYSMLRKAAKNAKEAGEDDGK